MAYIKEELFFAFDDLLMLPGYSDVLPDSAITKTRFTRNLVINIPLCSAAMDTVTESELAIAIAREGGIGIIHRNMTPQQQVNEVKKVKRFESGIIPNPITIKPDATIERVKILMEENDISGIPVVEGKKLVGIITNRDLRFEKDLSRKVKDVMTRNVINAFEDITMDRAKEIMQKHKIEKLPIIDKDGNLKGLITIKDIKNVIKYPNAAKDKLGRLIVGAAIGTYDIDKERASMLIENDVDVIVVDTAHGDSKYVYEMVRYIKSNYDIEVVAGNIVTSEAAKRLIDAGVDAVKVGVGPGSICTTRVVTGVGVPQASAIYNCAKVCNEAGVPLIADGGIKYSGDIAKAIGLGADSVMIGSLFAGTTESPGEVIYFQGRKYKSYRGMGSVGAMADGSAGRYFQEDKKKSGKFVPEGVEGMVPFKGPLSEYVYQLIGGLKSAMGYVGAKDIGELKEKAVFIRITGASLKESHPHDVHITKESPNYGI